MKFLVYDRHTIEQIKPNERPHVVVSIGTPAGYCSHAPAPPAKIATNDKTLGLLRLWFHDLDDENLKHAKIKERCGAACFSREQARQILDLVKSQPNAEVFIVHCDAGWSRSPGVAAAICKILGGDDNYFFRDYSPNRRVYRTLLEEHFGPMVAGELEKQAQVD